MEKVLQNMSRDKLIALASLIDLNDPKEPTSPTFTHMNASSGDDCEMPFKDLPASKMKEEIEYEISTAGGHTVANIFRGGKGVSYREIVWDVADHVKAELTNFDTLPDAEGKIAKQALKVMLEELTPEQRDELAENLERIAKDHGESYRGEGGVLAALTAAQLSGFGIYLAASTCLGAITGFLGFTLPFVFYTSMSKVISVVIGPIGWTLLGISAAYKVGSPNMKKLLPAVLFISAERNSPS